MSLSISQLIHAHWGLPVAVGDTLGTLLLIAVTARWVDGRWRAATATWVAAAGLWLSAAVLGHRAFRIQTSQTEQWFY
jgi:hypothetical protein